MIDAIGISVSALKAMRALRMAEIDQIDTLVNQLLRARSNGTRPDPVTVKDVVRVVAASSKREIIIERPAPPPPPPPPPRPDPIVVPPAPVIEYRPEKRAPRVAERPRIVMEYLAKLGPGARARKGHIARDTLIPYSTMQFLLADMRARGEVVMYGEKSTAVYGLPPPVTDVQPQVRSEATHGHV